MLYSVVGSNGQVGAMLAALPSVQYKRVKANAFVGLFLPASGQVHRYIVVDSLDTTIALNKRFEVGGSLGLFLQDGSTNPQIGPVLKINDKHGSWAISYRTGTGRELRVTRTFSF